MMTLLSIDPQRSFILLINFNVIKIEMELYLIRYSGNCVGKLDYSYVEFLCDVGENCVILFIFICSLMSLT